MSQNTKNTLVYLTGFMGSGKSTIGPILANTLGYAFADVDRLIEQRTGKSVREIFAEDGEKNFRALERQALEELSTREHHIVSLGGGSLTDARNFELVQRSGILIYLYSSQEHLVKRLQHKTDRPTLVDEEGELLPVDQLRARVRQLYHARSPIYAQAHLTIHTDDQKVGKSVDEIVKKLSAYIKTHGHPDFSR
jgi:shikimate kinase